MYCKMHAGMRTMYCHTRQDEHNVLRQGVGRVRMCARAVEKTRAAQSGSHKCGRGGGGEGDTSALS